jgi:hypothetical protein
MFFFYWKRSIAGDYVGPRGPVLYNEARKPRGDPLVMYELTGSFQMMYLDLRQIRYPFLMMLVFITIPLRTYMAGTVGPDIRGCCVNKKATIRPAVISALFSFWLLSFLP